MNTWALLLAFVQLMDARIYGSLRVGARLMTELIEDWHHPFTVTNNLQIVLCTNLNALRLNGKIDT